MAEQKNNVPEEDVSFLFYNSFFVKLFIDLYTVVRCDKCELGDFLFSNPLVVL